MEFKLSTNDKIIIIAIIVIIAVMIYKFNL
jgi:hypothetical protein